MIYITKFSVCLSFIYRYSQLFVVVFSCRAADIPCLNGFVPNPLSYVRIYGRNRLCYPCP